MYIEFRLPSGAGGMAAAMVGQSLLRHLRDWSDSNDIAMRTKTIKYTVRVTFDYEPYYEFFAMTWNPPSQHKFSSYLTSYRFIEPQDRVQ